MSARHVFLLAALIPLSLLLVAIVLVEQRGEVPTTQWDEVYLSHLFENGPQVCTRALTFESGPQVQGNVRKLYRTFCHPKIWKPVIFLFFFGATPTPGSTWFYFYTDVVKFSSTFLGTMVSSDTN
jgi:hypothetical protein